VLRAVQVLSAGGDNGVRPDFSALQSVEAATAAIAKWLDEERGRAMAKPATDTPSPAHVAVLRALQECLTSTPRAERAALVKRVDHCRQLVIDARGIGAELAMARLVGGAQPLNLGALEQLLTSRTPPHAAARDTTALRAVLAFDGERALTACVVSA